MLVYAQCYYHRLIWPAFPIIWVSDCVLACVSNGLLSIDCVSDCSHQCGAARCTSRPALQLAPLAALLSIGGWPSLQLLRCWVSTIDRVTNSLSIEWIWPALPLARLLLSIKYRLRDQLLEYQSYDQLVSHRLSIDCVSDQRFRS